MGRENPHKMTHCASYVKEFHDLEKKFKKVRFLYRKESMDGFLCKSPMQRLRNMLATLATRIWRVPNLPPLPHQFVILFFASYTFEHGVTKQGAPVAVLVKKKFLKNVKGFCVLQITVFGLVSNFQCGTKRWKNFCRNTRLSRSIFNVYIMLVFGVTRAKWLRLQKRERSGSAKIFDILQKFRQT